MSAAAPADASTTKTTDYTMDFTQFQRGGLSSGNMYKVIFGLNLSEPVRVYAEPAGFSGEGEVPPNVGTSQVLGFMCGAGSANSLDSDLTIVGRYLPPPGDRTWVDHIDLDMIPAQGEAVPANGKGVVMCFGYRTPAGGWNWDLTRHEAIWDPTTQAFTLRIPVQHGPVDALEIVSSGEAGALHVLVRKIVVATVPGG